MLIKVPQLQKGWPQEICIHGPYAYTSFYQHKYILQIMENNIIHLKSSNLSYSSSWIQEITKKRQVSPLIKWNGGAQDYSTVLGQAMAQGPPPHFNRHLIVPCPRAASSSWSLPFLPTSKPSSWHATSSLTSTITPLNPYFCPQFLRLHARRSRHVG